MSQVTFSVPDDIVSALDSSPDAVASKIRLAASIKLFEIGELSSGAAAQLAGVSKPEFLSRLGDFGVTTFDLTGEEVARDLESA